MAFFARIARPMAARAAAVPAPSARLGLSATAAGRRSATSYVGTKRGFSSTTIAAEKKYTKDHEWIELSADGKTGTIGITTYAAASLGDVVFVELPAADLTVSAGDAIGAVESVKSASDIMTPVTGKVVAANSVLEEQPGTINKGPEGEGWIAKIEVENQAELDELMSAADYKAFTEE